MASYPLLFYTNLAGAFVLLVVELIPALHAWRRYAVAIGVTALTLLWAALPPLGRWAISIWLPTSVLGGHIMLDVTPVTWACSLILGVVFSGTAWVEAIQRHSPRPLAGFLTFIALPLFWGVLNSGTLLTTLAVWAVFDLIWGVAGLAVGSGSERVTFGLAVHGLASLILWGVAMLLPLEGTGLLWWLTWPSLPLQHLLAVAALMRVGFYPFQIVCPRRVERTSALWLVYAFGSLSGVALLYRLLDLPAAPAFPTAWLRWGILSVLWLAVVAWSGEASGLVWGAQAMLMGGVVGAMAARDAALLLAGAAAWAAAVALLRLARGRARHSLAWAAPTWLALLFVMGVPPSPLGLLYGEALHAAPWLWRGFLVVGLGVAGAALWHTLLRPQVGRIVPPWPWMRLSMALGLALVTGGMIAAAGTLRRTVPDVALRWAHFSSLPLFLWGGAVVIAAALIRRGLRSRMWLRAAAAFVELVDLEWFYRAMWRGAEHLLTVLRVSAEVVEGSGAVLWSLLAILLILLVGVQR